MSFNISCAIGASHPSKAAIISFALSLVPSGLFISSSHALNTSFTSSDISSSKAFLTFSAILFLIASTPKNIPKPYSALSSNKELAHAGPCPSWFTVYGVDGAEPPQIDEHPVALATIILSPNNWVISLAYGVSPHPAHEPENSSKGLSNWLPLTVFLFIGFFLFLTFATA